MSKTLTTAVPTESDNCTNIKELIMADNNMVGTAPGSDSLGVDDCMGLVQDLIAKLRTNPPVITKNQLRLFLEKQNPFTVPTILKVNGSDPRWQSIQNQDYYYVNDSLSVADFPISNLGTRDVEYDVETFDPDPETQEVLDWQNAPGFRPADRAEAETYLDALPDSKKQLGESPVVSLCGAVADGHVACVYANDYGRHLYRYRLDSRWYRYCRFLRVRKSEL